MDDARSTAHHQESRGNACLIVILGQIRHACMSQQTVSARTLVRRATSVLMTISEVTGLLGLIFGLVGTCIGVFNYLRDRAKLIVRLQWDMAITGESEEKRVGCITVTNAGRRAIFMSHVALRLPKGGEISHFLIQGGLKGQKLSEGDPPAVFPVDQAGMESYANCWQKIVAQVSDSTGKEWVSKKVKSVPSWAKTPNLSVERDAAKARRPSP